MKTLQVKVNEDVATLETLHKWKLWFNGAKHFFTVKPLPPHGITYKPDKGYTRETKPKKLDQSS